jgi:hypothetical protein
MSNNNPAESGKISWTRVDTRLQLLLQVEAEKLHRGGKKAKGITQAWEKLATALRAQGPFVDYGTVKGPAMNKAYNSILVTAWSPYGNSNNGL